MTTFLRTAALLAVAAASAGAQSVVGRADDSWRMRERLDSGDRLRLSSPNGAISIRQGSGSEVEIFAEKTADRGASVSDVGFIVKKHADGLVVCAVYYDDDECDEERGYRQRRNWNRRQVRVSFIVTIPAGVLVNAGTGNGDVTINGAGSEVVAATGNGRVLVSGTTGRVTASTGNGRVTVEGARGPVKASTGNGAVSVTTSDGPVTASSGNGDIDVSMDRISRSAPMSFSTGSGRIVLSVPEDFGADMEASSGNGDVTTDLPIRLQGRIARSRLRGTLGGGGERLSLSTGNGDIEIRKSR
jgi:Putative adhesin